MCVARGKKTVQRLTAIIDWNLHGMIACPRANYLIDIVFFKRMSLSLNNRSSHPINAFKNQCFTLAQMKKKAKHILGVPLKLCLVCTLCYI